jgi:hypothetical protein
MSKTPDVDLTDQSMKEVRSSLGEMVEMSLRRARVAIFVLRQDGVVTLVDPALLKRLKPEDLAEFLLRSWPSEEDIEEFLVSLETIEQRTGS